MKFLKGLLFFAFLSLSTVVTNAQDIHFTQFYLTPLTTNPAFTGAFEGTFRLSGIYRDQWGSVINSPYRTPSFGIDAPLIKGLGKRDWIGVGAMLLNDQAGTGKLSNGMMMGSVAYHLALDKKAKSVLTFGIQGGMVQHKFDSQSLELQYDDELANNNIGGGVDRNNVREDQNYFDMNFGVLLKSEINKATRLNLGLAFNHLLTPEYYLSNNNQNNANDKAGSLPLNFDLHGQFFVDMGEKFQLKPAFLYQKIAGANEIFVHALGGYHLNEEKDMTLNFGIGYRLRDATKFIIGMDYKQFKVGAAYDLTISELRDASSSAGGFEIAATYIAAIFKKPDVKPVIFCPRF